MFPTHGDPAAGAESIDRSDQVVPADEVGVDVDSVGRDLSNLVGDGSGLVVDGGVETDAAADGTGPAAGTRVVTFGWSGAWAELRAVDTGELAVVPDDVDLGAASALPVAGVTALQAVRRLGPIVGRRVLVTGASGGVGRYAVQLASLAGAHVIASVGGPSRAEGLGGLGAAEIVLGPTGLSEHVYGVLETVGGAQLAEAFYRLEPTASSKQSAVPRANQRPSTSRWQGPGPNEEGWRISMSPHRSATILRICSTSRRPDA